MEVRKPILIQGAMQVEVKTILQVLEDITKLEIAGFIFYQGNIAGYPVVVSLTNIGSINSTIATTIGIINFKPVAVINQGIAGSYDKTVHKFDVVVGKECKNTNCYRTIKRKEGEGSNSLDWEMITFQSDDEKEEETLLLADDHLLNVVKNIQNQYPKGNVYFGNLGSGDAWNKEFDRINFIRKKQNVLCGDMESIGVYTVAHTFKVPVLGVRVMSDNELLEEEYDRETAIEAQKIALQIVKEYIKEIS